MSAWSCSVPVKVVEVSRTVTRSPSPVFEYLLDFKRYAGYSTYLTDVSKVSGGGDGTTQYEVTAAWRGIGGTVTTELTGVTPPERIEWRLADSRAAGGAWTVENTETAHATAPASLMTLEIRFDPGALGGTAISLPGFLPVDRLLGRLGPTVEAEAANVVERIVADLENDGTATRS